MLEYRAVQLYDPYRDDFIGWTIVVDGQTKLHSTHYYPDSQLQDLQDRLAELDDEQRVLHHWPTLDDPHVQNLLQDPTFEPLEMTWVDAPVTRNGRVVEDPTSDHDPARPWEAKLLTERKQVPKEPSAVTQRIKRAQELVARARMNKS